MATWWQRLAAALFVIAFGMSLFSGAAIIVLARMGKMPESMEALNLTMANIFLAALCAAAAR